MQGLLTYHVDSFDCSHPNLADVEVSLGEHWLLDSPMIDLTVVSHVDLFVQVTLMRHKRIAWERLSRSEQLF